MVPRPADGAGVVQGVALELELERVQVAQLVEALQHVQPGQRAALDPRHSTEVPCCSHERVCMSPPPSHRRTHLLCCFSTHQSWLGSPALV